MERRRDRNEFFQITWEQVVKYVEWDLHNNDLFVVNKNVHKQCQGIPIGSPLSAQLASIYCIMREMEHLETVKDIKLVFGRVVRFRDNIIMCKLQDITTKELLKYFEKMYNLELTIEQQGVTLESLEFILKFLKKTIMNNHCH